MEELSAIRRFISSIPNEEIGRAITYVWQAHSSTPQAGPYPLQFMQVIVFNRFFNLAWLAQPSIVPLSAVAQIARRENLFAQYRLLLMGQRDQLLGPEHIPAARAALLCQHLTNAVEIQGRSDRPHFYEPFILCLQDCGCQVIYRPNLSQLSPLQVAHGSNNSSIGQPPGLAPAPAGKRLPLQKVGQRDENRGDGQHSSYKRSPLSISYRPQTTGTFKV